MKRRTDMPHKFAFMAFLGYAQMNPRDVLASLKKIGYQGVEWTTSHFDPDKPLAELKALVQMTRDAGLEVSRIMAHEDLVSLDDRLRRQRIDRTLRVIAAAGECRVATVGTMTGPAPWDPAAPKVGDQISESAAWDQVFEAYEAFTQAARKAHVVVSSEGVFGMLAHDFYTHKWMMDQLDPDVQKVNFDPSHDVLYGNLDAGFHIRQWNRRIAHIHLKDAIGIPRLGHFVFPLLGEGNVDWPGFIRALDDIRYTGFLSVEFESFTYYSRVLESNPEHAAMISMNQIQKLFR